MTKQINIFIENRPGRVKSVTKLLYENNINIRTFNIQDRGNFGVIKLIVDKPHDAYLKLTGEGLACALKDILAVSIDDKPGNLLKLTTALTDNNINITDVYGFIIEPNKQGVCCMEVDEPGKIISVVESAGFTILKESDLYNM